MEEYPEPLIAGSRKVEETADSINLTLSEPAAADYNRLCRLSGPMMTLCMVMERWYNRPRSWICDHLGEMRASRCILGRGYTIMIAGSHSAIKPPSSFKEDTDISIASILRFIDSIGDTYRVVSRIGWENLFRLRKLDEYFPYDEYLLTRPQVARLIASHAEDSQAIGWIISILDWMAQERPLIKGGATSVWLESQIQYPTGFVIQSFKKLSGDIIRDYNTKVTAMLALLPDGVFRNSLKKDMTRSTPSGSPAEANSRTLPRWDKVVDNMRRWLSLTDVVETAQLLLPRLRRGKALQIYSKVRKYAGNTDLIQGQCMRMDRRIPLIYAEHASATPGSMERWFAWSVVENSMEDSGVLAAYTNGADPDMWVLPKITSFPVELADWLDRGQAPSVVTLNRTMRLTVPDDARERLAGFQSLIGSDYGKASAMMLA